MAVNLKKKERGIREILNELFKGKDSALLKYSIVRKTLYEITLWRTFGLPLREVDSFSKRYFSKRFLFGDPISGASDEVIRKGIKSLEMAVNIGCKGRCTRLVEELNAALEKKGLEKVNEIDKFLDWLTFDYEVVKDYYGNPALEPGYGFEIRMFSSDENRREFWAETQNLLNKDRVMSMQDICRRVLDARKKSVAI